MQTKTPGEELKGALKGLGTVTVLLAMGMLQRAGRKLGDLIEVPMDARITYERRPWAAEKEPTNDPLDQTWGESWSLLIQGKRIESFICTHFGTPGGNVFVAVEWSPESRPRVWLLDQDKRRDITTMRGLYDQQNQREAPPFDPLAKGFQSAHEAPAEQPTEDPARAPATFIRSTLTYDAATDRFQVWTSDGGNMSLAMEDLDALQRQGEAARTASRIGQIRARHEQATERCTECGHEERCHKLGEPEVSDNHVAIEVAPGACEADGCLCDEFRKPW
jgi:hypothetical protein